MEISAAVFYLMCSVIIILIILLAFFVTIILKMSARAYRLLAEGKDDSKETTNRYNIQFQKRKDSDDMLRVYTDFTFDHPGMQTKMTVVKPDTVYENNENNLNKDNKKIVTEALEREVPQKSASKSAVALPPLILRQKMEDICAELIQAQKTLGKNINKETFELTELERKSKLQGSVMDRAKSISTPALDLYDVLPNDVNPICISEDNNGYSKPKNGATVILDEDSGYLLPLTYKMSYANAN